MQIWADQIKYCKSSVKLLSKYSQEFITPVWLREASELYWDLIVMESELRIHIIKKRGFVNGVCDVSSNKAKHTIQIGETEAQELNLVVFISNCFLLLQFLESNYNIVLGVEGE